MGGKKWDVAAQKYRPLDAARIAVVGEELGTQRDAATDLLALVKRKNAQLEAERSDVCSYYEDLLVKAEAELAQLRRYNEDLVQMCIARVGERDAALAELATLRADWAEHLRRGAQTVVAPVPAAPPTKPEIPARALRFSA